MLFQRPRRFHRILAVALTVLATSVLSAQLSRDRSGNPDGGRRGPRGEAGRSGMPRGGFGGGGGFGRDRVPDRSELPTWEIAPAFQKDVFTFARIEFDVYNDRGFGQSWKNDYPDCDWNFSLRLHELTSFDVDPNGKVLRLTDPLLFELPFIYMSNAQQISLNSDEVAALRRYLLNGGFLMIDDIWAPAAWRHVRGVLQEVVPEHEPRELTLQHEIFHIVYDLKTLPQVPSIRAWRNGDSFEYWHGDPEGDEAPHFYGLIDPHGRLMVLVCHNNDIGDGWEREGEDVEYFQQYSEKHSYPLGINIITYIMTH